MPNAAELLRRSAEYARKAVNDVVGLMWRQPQPALEPAYSRYRPRGRAPRLRSPASHQRHFSTMQTRSITRQRPRCVVIYPGFVRNFSLVAASQVSINGWKTRSRSSNSVRTGLALFQHKSPYRVLRTALVRNASQLSLMGQEVRRRLGELATFRYPLSLPMADTLADDIRRGPALVPTTTVAVEFDFEPQLLLPLVAELNESTLDAVKSALRTSMARLTGAASDIQKLAQFGELPISAHGSKVRVHFPNCDTEKVKLLLCDQGVLCGRVIEILGAAPGGVPPVDMQPDMDGDESPGLSFSDSSAPSSASQALTWN